MDFEQIARELEIDTTTYLSLVKRFCELTVDDVAALDRSLASSDFNGVYSAAHSVKGASAGLSLWDIYEAASAICETTKAGSSESVAVLSSAIRTEVDSLAKRVAEAEKGRGDDA